MITVGFVPPHTADSLFMMTNHCVLHLDQIISTLEPPPNDNILISVSSPPLQAEVSDVKSQHSTGPLDL